MTTKDLFKSKLWHDFEETAKAEKQSPISILNELIREYIESRSDSELFDAIAKEGFKSDYTEDDAVEVVRRARLEKMRG
jgi:hypothetical protein